MSYQKVELPKNFSKPLKVLAVCGLTVFGYQQAQTARQEPVIKTHEVAPEWSGRTGVSVSEKTAKGELAGLAAAVSFTSALGLMASLGKTKKSKTAVNNKWQYRGNER